MKKFFKPVLIMGFLMLVASCTSDDNKGVNDPDPDPTPEPVVTELIVPKSMNIEDMYDTDFSTHYTFDYNENTNLLSKMKITYGDKTSEVGTFFYDGTRLLKIESLLDNEPSAMIFNYNENGQISTIISEGGDEDEEGTFQLKYNANGLISHIVLGEEQSPLFFSLTYNASKSVVKSELMYLGSPVGNATTYEYDTKHTPFKNTNINFDLGQYDLLVTTMFSQSNQHNVTKVVNTLPNDELVTLVYDYTYDAKGYPIKVVVTDMEFGIESIITYEYTTITITE